MKTKEINKRINAEYASALASAKTLKSAIRDYKSFAFDVDTKTTRPQDTEKHITTLCILCGVNRENVESLSALDAMTSINKIKSVIINNYPFIGTDNDRSVVYLTVKRVYFAQSLESIKTVYTFSEVTDYKKVIKMTAKNMRQNYVDRCNGKKTPATINVVKVNMTNQYYTDTTLTQVFDVKDYKQVIKDKNGNWMFK